MTADDPTGQVTVHDTVIPALDGYPLAATLYEAHKNNGAPVVIMSAAAAVPRQFYRRFCRYLAESLGALVVAYDYRGIGGSAPKNLKGFSARMRDWGILDFPGVVDWVRRTHPGRTIRLVGNSFGGLALGLTDRNAHIERAVFVTTISGYWGTMPAPERYRLWAIGTLVGPALSLPFGYVPASKVGMGEDMARATFMEWTRWMRNPDFLFGDKNLPELRHYADYSGKILAFGFTDDDWGPPQNVEAVLSRFTAADTEHRHIAPADIGVRKIGHLGFFRPEFRDTLWRQAADWLAAPGAE